VIYSWIAMVIIWSGLQLNVREDAALIQARI
jgi:hypothetical protein